MKHYGDITKLNGYLLPATDVVTGGSPCQDLSIAGKRAGLEGERSGLYVEQIRVIKEMRASDQLINGTEGADIRPRYMVWENVPGAFSSNKGEDFRVVLEEAASVCDEAAVIPKPPKWHNSGAIMGDGWSIAWRVFDAQFWGVPQRRRRIYLVADFGGHTAPEILFKREGLRGNLAESRKAWEEVAAAVGDGVAFTVRMRAGCDGGGKDALVSEEKSLTLALNNDQTVFVPNRINSTPEGISGAVSSKWAKGTGGPAGDECYNLVIEPQLYDMTHAEEVIRPVRKGIAPTLNSRMGTGGNQVPVMLACPEPANTLLSKGDMSFRDDSDTLVSKGLAVRRLLPLECERLMGFPDGWTDVQDLPEDLEFWRKVWDTYAEIYDTKPKTDKAILKWLKNPTSDTAQYKALGNSVALPNVYYVLYGVAEQLGFKGTLGSLFDGIGGFPVCWEAICGQGTALWASEIEPFPIAVTRRRL